jgi:RNA polymerase I-specific transcription initiation factor RRN6
MAKPSPYDLNYGHFGQATYNLEDGSWTFDRAPGHERVLHQLGPWKVVLQPASSFLISSSESARDAQQAAKSLGKNKFEIVPSLDVLPALALESTAVKNVTETYDPAIGDLLSFGSIPLEGSSARARRVAAVPGGQCGNLLRLVMLSRDRQGWASDKSIWLEGHTFVNEENASGYWVEDAVPIQQLCFAQTESRSPFLAARFPTKTVLFRPILHHRPRPAMRSRFYDLPASHINPRPILSLSHERTGGAPHAHVTFNPDYQRQLGIVDVTGNWSIWEIDGGHKGARYSVSCVVSGLLNIDAPDPEDETKTAIEDGWSRILWVGDVNTILLCNRRRLEIIGIKGGDPVSLNCPQPVQSHSADWILDIKHHASSKHLFYVLTSSRLIVMAVTCQNDVVGQRDLVPGATVLLSWTHFRGLEDITLQLGIPNVSDDGKYHDGSACSDFYLLVHRLKSPAFLTLE